MSITDELREFAPHLNIGKVALAGWKEALLAIADRIDTEHEKLMQEQPFTIDMVPMTDENMAEHGWVRGPLDADGVLIHFKDKVTVPWSEKVYEVGGFSYQENIHTGRMTIWINVHENGKYKALCAANSCHHYNPTTVEDVLKEMCDALNDVRMPFGSGMISEEIIAEYAAKLQLRGDGE